MGQVYADRAVGDEFWLTGHPGAKRAWFRHEGQNQEQIKAWKPSGANSSSYVGITR